jgi:hypothetical protein
MLHSPPLIYYMILHSPHITVNQLLDSKNYMTILTLHEFVSPGINLNIIQIRPIPLRFIKCSYFSERGVYIILILECSCAQVFSSKGYTYDPKYCSIDLNSCGSFSTYKESNFYQKTQFFKISVTGAVNRVPTGNRQLLNTRSRLEILVNRLPQLRLVVLSNNW